VTCTSCSKAEAKDQLGLCEVCTGALRLEILRGFWRLGNYLGKRAAFDRWLVEHDRV
jgi:hypothetical protein